MSRRPPPDPVAVLRGHRASVTDISFHPFKPILFSGSADGEVRIWDTLQHRTVSSAWLHSVAHGIVAVDCGSSLGTNKFASQGRDGTVKIWEFDDAGLSRIPSLTIKTNSYHFCKFSMLKNDPVWSTEGKEPEDCYRTEPGGMSDGEILEAKRDKANTNQSCSKSSGVNTNNEGLQYVALSGENSSEVEIWDLKSAQKIVQLPSSNPSDSSSACNKAASCQGCACHFNCFYHPNHKDF